MSRPDNDGPPALRSASDGPPGLRAHPALLPAGVGVVSTPPATLMLRIEEEIFDALFDPKDVPRVLAFLRNPQADIDYTRRSSRFGCSLLHLVAQSLVLSDEEAASILTAICEHVQRHHRDRIDWGRESTSVDEEFISLAARRQRLSLLYPIVREVPFYADRTAPIPLKMVWTWDVEALDEEDRANFTFAPKANVFPGSRATGELWRLTQHMYLNPPFVLQRPPDAERVRACVRDGADVLYRLQLHFGPLLVVNKELLLDFIKKGTPACIIACLEEMNQPLRFSDDLNAEKLEAFLSNNPHVAKEDVKPLAKRIEDQMRRGV